MFPNPMLYTSRPQTRRSAGQTVGNFNVLSRPTLNNITPDARIARKGHVFQATRCDLRCWVDRETPAVWTVHAGTSICRCRRSNLQTHHDNEWFQVTSPRAARLSSQNDVDQYNSEAYSWLEDHIILNWNKRHRSRSHRPLQQHFYPTVVTKVKCVGLRKNFHLAITYLGSFSWKVTAWAQNRSIDLPTDQESGW